MSIVMPMKYDKLYSLFPDEGSHCIKGCGKCCVATVWVTKTEAESICRWLEKNLQFETLQEQIKYANLHPEDCPFLKSDKTCMIYAVRPFVCRLFGHTPDVEGVPSALVKRISQKCPEGAQFTEIPTERILTHALPWMKEARVAGVYINEFRVAVYVREDGVGGTFGKRPPQKS